MTQLNWGRKEGKIRFFITIPEYVWTLLTQEPSPTKVSAQTVAVIESEQQQQQQQNTPYQLPSPLFTEAWLCNRNLHVGIQWLGANGEGGTHRHIQVDVLMCTPQKASKAHTRKKRTSCIWGPASQRGEFTYSFWFIWWLNLLAFEFLPVNIPEKCMFFNVSFPFRSTTQTLAWVFGH